MISIRGKMLSEFPEILKSIDNSKHPDIDFTKIIWEFKSKVN